MFKQGTKAYRVMEIIRKYRMVPYDELTSMTYVSKPYVRAVIRRLEDAGLVRREILDGTKVVVWVGDDTA